MLRRFVPLSLVFVAACSGLDGKSYLDVIVTTDGEVAHVDHLTVSVTLGSRHSKPVVVMPPSMPFDLKPSNTITFGLRFDSDISGGVRVDVAALDLAGATLAQSFADSHVTPGKSTTVTITLPGVMPLGDLSVKDGPPLDQSMADLWMSDLATPDLAMPDLTMPGLATPDLAPGALHASCSSSPQDTCSPSLACEASSECPSDLANCCVPAGEIEQACTNGSVCNDEGAVCAASSPITGLGCPNALDHCCFSTLGGWFVPYAIGNLEGTATQPSLSLSRATGRAFAVWVQEIESIKSIQAAVFEPSTGWSATAQIDPGGDEIPIWPRVDAAADGSAMAVWDRKLSIIGSSEGVRFSQWTPDLGWGLGALLDTLPNAGNSRIAVFDQDNALALWSNASQIYANVFTQGSGWSTWQNIDSNDNQPAEVAANAAGSAIAVWGPCCSSMTSGVFFSTTSGWTPTEGLGVGSRRNVAINSMGEAIVAVSLSSDSGIGALRYSPISNPKWSPIEMIPGLPAGAAVSSDVALNEFGQAVVAFMFAPQGSSSYAPYVSEYTPGSGWSAGAPLIENAGDTTVEQVALGKNGVAVAVWRKQGSISVPKASLWVARKSGIGGWQTHQLDVDAGSGYPPSIGIDDSGRALVLWESGGKVMSSQFR